VVHVGIADQNREDEATDEFICVCFPGRSREHGGDVGVATMAVFVLWEQPERLRKILHVDAPNTAGAIESRI
jgi:hypothetical protein